MGKAEPYRPLLFCSKCFMHQWGTVRTGADGVSILFAVDMTQPYLD